jgi:hypothetical protein
MGALVPKESLISLHSIWNYWSMVADPDLTIFLELDEELVSIILESFTNLFANHTIVLGYILSYM